MLVGGRVGFVVGILDLKGWDCGFERMGLWICLVKLDLNFEFVDFE